MLRKALLITALSVAMTSNCYAMTCHELAMSYIIADQDPPTEAGDYLYHEDGTAHRLTETTGYYRGTIGSHGDKVQKGHVAYTPESYGCAMEVYKARETENGYELGDYIGLYEIRDTGYGRTTGQGKSAVRADRVHQGTIEAGLSADFRFDNLRECQEWMKETKGMIFIRIIPAKG